MVINQRKSGKNAGSVWWLVYGKTQHKSGLLTIIMGLLRGNCFYIKGMDVLCKQWNCKGCRQIFTRNEDPARHLQYEKCTGGKTKIIRLGGKFKHILNSSEKVFYVATQNLVVLLVSGLRHRPWKQVNTFIIKCADVVANVW